MDQKTHDEQKVPASEEPDSPECEKRKKKKSRKKAWIIALAVIVCLCLVVYSLWNGAVHSLYNNDVITASRDNPTKRTVQYEGQTWKYRSDLINILCIGTDRTTPGYEGTQIGDQGLADTIFLCSLEPKTHHLRLLAIPRDTMCNVEVHDVFGNYARTDYKQITLQYEYGLDQQESCELMAKTVSSMLYQIPIQKTVSFNMAAIPVINDAVGGVDVEVMEDLRASEYGPEFKQGEVVHLEGDYVLGYLRIRDVYQENSSLSRLERQKQYLSALIPAMKQAVSSNLLLPFSIYDQISSNMVTNLSVADLMVLIPQLLHLKVDDDSLLMLPGEAVRGVKYLEYYIDQDELKSMIINNFYEPVSK